MLHRSAAIGGRFQFRQIVGRRRLWIDQAALDAFCFHWNMWAKRYKHVSAKKISFDLVNEPGGSMTPVAVTKEVRALAPPAYAALWKVLLSVDLVRTLEVPIAPPKEAAAESTSSIASGPAPTNSRVSPTNIRATPLS